MFHAILDSGNIVLADLQKYLELVSAFFEVSPVGGLHNDCLLAGHSGEDFDTCINHS